MNLLDPPEQLAAPVRGRLRLLDTEHGVSLMWVIIWLLAALGGAAFLAKGADGPKDPQLISVRQGVPGFGEMAFTVQPDPGLPEVDARCALIADTPQAQEQGMMHRRDLAGHDAMIFRFPNDQEGAFWNRNVPIDLSIAWFDSSGRFIATTDMAPCADRDDCPLYRAPLPFRYALEVPKGGLPRLGVGAGTVLSVGGTCPGG